MDRRAVFRALGDATRYAVYCEVAGSASPRSTSEIAASLGLHPNTVRPHLERLRQVGLLDVSTDSQGTVGRPQHLYLATGEAPSLGLEHPALPILAELLAEVADCDHPGVGDPGVGERAEQVGRQRGRLEAASVPGRSCVGAVVTQLAELGFDPATARQGRAVTVHFTRCPYRELAEAHPDLVCHLHRGLVEGMVEAMGGAAVGHFATLADRDPCRVELVVQ